MKSLDILSWPSKLLQCNLYFLGSSECEQSGIPFISSNMTCFRYEKEYDEHVQTIDTPCSLPFFKDKRYIVRVACGGMHSLVLLASGEVYSWGCNDEGALGYQGSGVNPELVPLPKPATQISAGDSHSMALVIGVNSRDVYYWGSFRSEEGVMSTPTQAPHLIDSREFDNDIPMKICSGYNHCLILTRNKKQIGKVYAWGDSSCGKIGRKPPGRNKNLRSLKKFPISAKDPVDVWACGNHSFYKTYQKLNRLKKSDFIPVYYAWGLNRNGQLGLGHQSDVYVPEQVKSLDNLEIVQITGGEFHTLFLLANGVVMSCGLNKDGQLGLNLVEEQFDTPQEVPIPENSIKISSGAHFNYAISSKGAIYSWGVGDNFVLGNKLENVQNAPIQVDPNMFNNEVPLEIASGGQHAIFVCTDSSELYEVRGKKRLMKSEISTKRYKAM